MVWLSNPSKIGWRDEDRQEWWQMSSPGQAESPLQNRKRCAETNEGSSTLAERMNEADVSGAPNEFLWPHDRCKGRSAGGA